MPASHFICPLCQLPLGEHERSLRCDNNHNFDYAKEGYINLLPVQQKKSLHPGDDQNMVQARRDFLQQGFYQFLQAHLVQLSQTLQPATIVDLGCGEGYYTAALQTALPDANVYGIDISKPAVKYAAKRNKQINYCVATNAHLPLATGSTDIIVNVFAPITDAECKRILNQNGVLISVNPGAKHLFELKQHIYDNVELHEECVTPEGFVLQKRELIEQTITLESQTDLNNLLTMTPFGWKITEQKKQRLLATDSFQVTLSFSISHFVPTNENS